MPQAAKRLRAAFHPPLIVQPQPPIVTLKGEVARMRQFKWIEWNLQKVAAHNLSAAEVEASFDLVFSLQERKDGSFQIFASIPSGRRICVIWRYDREDDEMPDVFGELGDAPIFVITAY